MCCERFPIGGGSHADVLARFAKFAESAEVRKVSGMIILLDEGLPEGGALYSCIHWDPASGLCRDYANRPLMCSAFPYESMWRSCWLTLPQLSGRELSSPPS
jgi:Fe-S-cluster containining protein